MEEKEKQESSTGGAQSSEKAFNVSTVRMDNGRMTAEFEINEGMFMTITTDIKVKSKEQADGVVEALGIKPTYVNLDEETSSISMGFRVWMPVWMLMMGMKNLKEVKPANGHTWKRKIKELDGTIDRMALRGEQDI